MDSLPWDRAPYPIAWTTAELATPGTRPNSRQQRSLARAVNDRLRSVEDFPWRVAWMTYGLARLVRNPDASGFLFPSEHEYWSFYSHLAPELWAWPIAGPGEPEGANLGSALPQFVFGNPATPDEPERLATLFPMRINGQPPANEADRWTLGKLQRGAITPDGAAQYAPALEAAQTALAFAFHPQVFHGRSYGGYFPEAPQDPLIPVCGGVSSGWETWPNRTPYYTALRSDVSTTGLHGTIGVNDDGMPTVTYIGSCPCGSPETTTGHVIWVSKYPFAWYLYVNDGTVDGDGNCGYAVDRLATNEWIEGPYAGSPELVHGDPSPTLRAAALYHSLFRGSDAQRASYSFSPRNSSFDNDDFFRRQYPLAPARGVLAGESIVADYPRAVVVGSQVNVPLLGYDTRPWVPASGFTLTGYHARSASRSTNARATVRYHDGTRTLATLTLPGDGSDYAASLWGRGDNPSALYVEVIQSPGASVECEVADLVEYMPQVWDAYLLLRVATGTSP